MDALLLVTIIVRVFFVFYIDVTTCDCIGFEVSMRPFDASHFLFLSLPLSTREGNGEPDDIQMV